MTEKLLVDLIPSYEAAALEMRCLIYFWMAWPEVCARSFARSFA